MIKDLISLIIPTYNVEKYLKDTFKSIKNQTYQNIEPIFVDDGSTDSTPKLLDAFKRDFPKAIVIHQKNTGISGARNAAIKAANGEYLYIFDPDDIFHPRTLEILHNLIIKHNADCSICKFKKVPDKITFNKIKFSNSISKKIKTYEGKDAITAQYLSSAILVHAPWNKLFKHEIVKKFPSYPNVFIQDCLFLEDVPFQAEYFSFTNKVVYLPKVVYFFRQRKTSNTHSKFNPKKLSVYNGWKGYNCLLNDDFKESQLYVKIKYCIDDLFILFLLRNSDFDDHGKIKEIYKRYKENLPYCIKGKRLQWYRKYLLWTSKPFIYLMVRNKLKIN